MEQVQAQQERVQADWRPLGRMAYEEALATQQARVDALLTLADQHQTVYAVEHPPTITIGRSGSFANIVGSRERLEALGMQVFEVDRGGDVTYHGPGQLVLYPVFHLSPWRNDIGWYVRMLEESIIRALANADIQGTRVSDYPGVWVGQNKVAAVGVRVKRRPDGEFVTMHGVALNVSTDLSHFATIVPCGIVDKGVTSISQLLGTPCHLVDWERNVRDAFTDVFEVQWRTNHH